MMLTEDIANLLYKECQVFDVPVYRKGNIPKGEVTEDRVVIVPKSQTPSKYWRKCFVEVNLCTPDIGDGQANLRRLDELEKAAFDLLDGKAGEYDGYAYKYSVSSIGIEADLSMKCHYVNVRILFEILNVMK